MTYIVKPKNHHPDLERNDLGLTRRDYEGTVSSLCAGCGHDSISAAILEACFQLNILSHKVAKLSGIGCSSKAPAYFLNQSHGFNSVHGRMPSVATGANLANHELLYLGISGDGDTASIGIGQFVHAVRRQLNVIYVIENNGTVTGVIPEFLMRQEVGHTGITKLEIVSSMHERKARMAELSDGFIVLPGGLGTLEELFEIVTWKQLGLHNKPIIVFNSDGYWDNLQKTIKNMSAIGYLRPENIELALFVNKIDEIFSKLN